MARHTVNPRVEYTNKDGQRSKSRYPRTKAWRYRDMRVTTKTWIEFDKSKNLILKTNPRENMIAQVYNLIKMYGRYYKNDVEQSELTYTELREVFELQIKKPESYDRNNPRTPFCKHNYLIC